MRVVLRLNRERRGARPRALALGLLLAAASSAQAGPAAQQPTKFEGDSLPDPPRQRLAWEPPRVPLPEKLVTATAKLFEQGLADPRGCDYREVEVVSGSVWGVGGSRFKTHAWVLPASTGQGGSRFAVAWNGLVYPLDRVGEKADLRQDVLALIEADERRRAAGEAGRYSGLSDYLCCAATPNVRSFSHQESMLIKAAMLLRLGEGELARRAWEAWMGGAETNDVARDPYLMFASEWTWALFDLALRAHTFGDDRLALQSARTLERVRNAVESEAEARHLSPSDNASVAPDERFRYLPFLKPLPALLADQERRAREGGRGMPSLRDRLGARRVPVAAVSVEELIRNLDDARATLLGRDFPQLKQPDAVSFGGDELVKALVEKGDEAVEPLIRVLEDDTRLIRTVRFRWDSRYERHLMGVHEAAYAALAGILKFSPFGGVTPYDELRAPGMERRRALAARVRLYVKQYAGRPPEEHWYRALADDGATLEQWRQGAAWIVTPHKNPLGNGWVDSLVRYRRKGEKYVLRGEALRQKAGPSVSQLLVRRMEDSFARLGDENWLSWLYGLKDFTVALSAWDGAEGLGELRRMTAQLEKFFAGEKVRARSAKKSYLISNITGIYDERLALGDPRAAVEYAGWMRALRPEDANYGGGSLFYLASKYQDLPVIAEAVTRMFEDPASPWKPVSGKLGEGSWVDTLEFLKIGLLDFPAFRARVVEGLADKTVVGTLLNPRATNAGPYDPTIDYDVKVENLLAAAVAGEARQGDVVVRFTIDAHSPAPPSAPVNIRACDVYAWKLRGFEGAPWIELYWPEAERDAAVAASAQFIREHVGPFVYWDTRAYRRR